MDGFIKIHNIRVAASLCIGLLKRKEKDSWLTQERHGQMCN
jgi:hypothetical protein